MQHSGSFTATKSTCLTVIFHPLLNASPVCIWTNSEGTLRLFAHFLDSVIVSILSLFGFWWAEVMSLVQHLAYWVCLHRLAMKSGYKLWRTLVLPVKWGPNFFHENGNLFSYHDWSSGLFPRLGIKKRKISCELDPFVVVLSASTRWTLFFQISLHRAKIWEPGWMNQPIMMQRAKKCRIKIAWYVLLKKKSGLNFHQYFFVESSD